MSTADINVHPDNDSQRRTALSAPAADEFDYDVTFTSTHLGLKLYPDRAGKNCIVVGCLSETAKSLVDVGSMILSINGSWMEGLAYTVIRDQLKAAAQNPPLNVTLRVKLQQ